jgi:transposase
MRIHANARTCPNSRRLLVRRIEEEGWSLMVAAEAAGISERSARKWLGRWRAEGEAGLLDRSSAPKRVPSRLPADRLEAIEALRRLRMTAAEIAEILGMALSTVSRWLARIGLGKRSRLTPPEPPNRYERKRPGELIHVDIKKLGRIHHAGHRVTANRRGRGPRRQEGKRRVGAVGWEFVHVCVDDATRLAYVEVLPDEKGATAAAFLRRAVSWFRGMGIEVERVLSDNGACYRSRAHAEACAELEMRHLFTQPYRPQTNGKACVLVSACRPVGRRGSPRPRV